MMSKINEIAWDILLWAGAAVLFMGSIEVLRWIDPTAGVYDIGFLQKPFVAAFWYTFTLGVAWLVARLWLPTIINWVTDGGFSEAWKELTGREKVYVALGSLAFLILTMLWTLTSVPL